MTNDEELMRRTAGGDLAAFDEIVLRYQQTAWRLSSRFMGNTQDAQDVAQEAFIRIFQAAPRYRHTASFSTYLYRVIVRLCMDAAQKKRETVIEDIEGSNCPNPDPSQRMLDRERDNAVRNAISRLPSRQRTAVTLREFMALSYDLLRCAYLKERSFFLFLSRSRLVAFYKKPIYFQMLEWVDF
jgi:RNA polymerase sigma-70 factor (ECF subfamily)